MVFQLLLTHLCVPKSERLDLKFPMALLPSDYFIHGLKLVATNRSPLWGWTGDIHISVRLGGRGERVATAFRPWG
jgi:hypothetical protein